MRLLLLLACLAPSALAQDWEPHPALAPLAPLVGGTWQGTFPSPDGSGATVTDVSRYEWAMRGQALRNIHTLEGGSYGGETLIWAEGDSLRFVYVTSGGFTTTGAGTLRDDGALVVEEVVEGHPTVDRVRSVSVVDAEGRLTATSEMRDGGEWQPGRTATYVRTPGATLAPGYASDCADG